MFRLIVCLLCAIPVALSAQSATTYESWVLATDLWGNPAYQALELDRHGDRLIGTLDGDKLEGKLAGGVVQFVVTDTDRKTYRFDGKLSGAAIRGVADYPDSNHPSVRVKHEFSARRVPDRPAGAPRRHEFKPVSYANEFSAHRLPVLTLWPGDSVHTTTIDSGGVDENGVTRALFGNPQTGPFHVAGAVPGDTLIVKILHLRPNRNYADSLDCIVGRALGTNLAAKAQSLCKPVRWEIDLQRGIARPLQASGRLENFSVPLHPMLGGLAVAPGFGFAPISTGDTGRFGGNMDFNEVVEGNTVYLPVQQPGALLYLGDAHAAQGDGETSQYALETSMDVEFSVDVAHAKSIAMPRVESPEQIMVLGQAGSLDDALRSATDGLVQWLEQDYDLSLSESAQILGSSVQYVVANLAGRSVGVAAKLDKKRLANLPGRNKP